MAKGSALSSGGDPVHTRTTAGTEESQAVVIAQDGTDNVAALIQRGALPGPNDFGMAVVPLNSPRPAYQAVTANLTSPTAVGVTRPLTIWHPATLAKDVFIIELGGNYQFYGHTAGRFDYELQFMSAENGSPGGTSVPAQPLNRALPASGLTLRSTPAAPTLTGNAFQRVGQGTPTTTFPMDAASDGVILYRAKDLDDYSDAIMLRNAQAEGLAITQNILVALTGTAPIFNMYARWVERT